ncbi:hypothetical protein AMTRI_Chr08g159820 [Amborella trichopoda]
MVELKWKNQMAEQRELNSATNHRKPIASDSMPVHHNFVEDSADPLKLNQSDCLAYEQYLHLGRLWALSRSRQFPEWRNEPLLKPSLQALEITFRFISLVLSDPRPYINKSEWKRRLQSLACLQIELIASICEDDEDDRENIASCSAPTVNLHLSNGVLTRGGSLQEVWKINGASSALVSQTSEQSLLPRLGAWQKSQDIASKLWFSIECHFQRAPFTLGLGEPNLSGKPVLEYDLVCKPSEVHSLKRSPLDPHLNNHENQSLYTTHQIRESWLITAQELLKRIHETLESKDFKASAKNCWLLEKIWKLLAEIEDLHLLMDPDDFLRLKKQLAIKTPTDSGAFCLRSRVLMAVAEACKDLKHRVPAILGVEADPSGGPSLQEEAMRLYHGHGNWSSIHLLQALQAIEAGLKKFFFSYQQLVIVVMGSSEAMGSHGNPRNGALSQLFMDPPYFPSLDAAKTFLGDFWQYEAKAASVRFS